MVNKFTMKAFRLLFSLLLVSSTVSAQSWEQPYADRGFTVQDTVICGRRAVFVVPPQANGRWIARPAFIGAFAQVDACICLTCFQQQWKRDAFPKTREKERLVTQGGR